VRTLHWSDRMVDGRARLYLASLLVALSALGTVAAYLFASDIQSGDVAAWIAAHRYAWYAPPLVALAFVLFSLLPVMLLVSLTGVAFGPLLGPLYAMAGCLASASTAFAIGRWLGPRHARGWGGERVAKVMRALNRNGTLAVFLIRKIPAPFMLVNVLLGASAVRYREFIIGTLLGMAAMVIALAGFGYHLVETWRDPSMERIIRALLFLAIPLTLAWLINRRLRAGNRDAWSV
jgi:phospholipase D1/2